MLVGLLDRLAYHLKLIRINNCYFFNAILNLRNKPDCITRCLNS